MIGTIVTLIVFASLFVTPFVYISRHSEQYNTNGKDDLPWYLKKDPQRQRKYLIEKYLGSGTIGRGWTIAFKGFRKGLTCRGFKYVEGKTFHCEGTPRLCMNGFHACLYPRDCYNHYSNPEDVYHIVFLKNLDGSRDVDSKICGGIIQIGPEIDRKYVCQ